MEQDTQKIILMNQYLSDFSNSLNKRSLSSIFFSGLFDNLLEWNFILWDKETKFLGENDTDTWFKYYQTLGRLDAIIGSITERSITESGMDMYYFFEHFSKHVEKYKEKMNVIKKDKNNLENFYADHVLTHFCRIFFSKIANSPNSYNIWELYFPKPPLANWLITENPFIASKDLKYIVPRIILRKFIEWAQSKISAAKKGDYDKELDEVSENLFPNVDPARWAKILIFVLTPFDPKNRVGYVVSRPWNFGFSSRIRSFSGYEDNDAEFQKKFQDSMKSADEQDKNETCKLALAIFGNVFTKENLARYTKEAEGLVYAPDSEEEKRRKFLLQIFKELTEFKL
jgi:hypothetical protein